METTRSAAIATAQGHRITDRTRTRARASMTVKSRADERPRRIWHYFAPVRAPSA
jgi:hypothetical protein